MLTLPHACLQANRVDPTELLMSQGEQQAAPLSMVEQRRKDLIAVSTPVLVSIHFPPHVALTRAQGKTAANDKSVSAVAEDAEVAYQKRMAVIMARQAREEVLGRCPCIRVILWT